MKEKTKGITLVALVVTVIVLLILAGVTITYVLGDRGIIQTTKDARRKTDEAVGNEQNDIGDLADWLKEEQEEAENYGKLPLVTTVTDTNHTTIRVRDTHNNVITVPQGFKVVAESEGKEITVQNGVVIEDSAGNQFIWIPVGVVTKNNGTKSEEIKLGRYTFDTTTGEPTMAENSYQYAYTAGSPTNYTYTNTVTIDSYFQELSTARDGVVAEDSTAENATAKDLAGFVDSVRTNGGYYIARYEASYGSGYNEEGSTDSEKYGSAKPLSKPSTANGETINYTPGTLWNNITQLNASKVARNMYAGNKDINGNVVSVESDLVNSYAWDTAIVFIQTYSGDSDYSMQKSKNTSLANTGVNNDKVCNIHDMASNCFEWTTETRAYSNPYTFRGGNWDVRSGMANCASNRIYPNVSYCLENSSFRSILYVK